MQLVATMRTTDIVRDADILHLYKRAGFSRILLGIETTDAGTAERIHKNTTVQIDRRN